MSQTLTVTMSQEKAEESKAFENEAADQTETTKKEEDYKNYPFRDIKDPHVNDVLYGRGGGTNHHPGNKRYRKLVEDRKVEYVACKRLDKPLVALGIIREWRAQKPPGRFLKMDDNTGLWNDVGDKKAREKTSQALREKAPQIRLELDKERQDRERAERGDDASDSDDDVYDRTTRFAAGTNLEPSRPGTVKRDHSLGVEYVNESEGVSLEGFSWQDPVRSTGVMSLMDFERIGSQGSYNPNLAPPLPYPSSHPGSRMGSHSSFAPPPGVAYPPDRMPSWCRFDSWGSMGPSVPPPPPPYGYPPPPIHHSGSWDTRDHSLAMNPLAYATATQAAYPAAFDQTRTSSGQWRPPPPSFAPPHYLVSGGPPPPPPRPAKPPPPPEQYHARQPSSPQNSPLSPKYSVDVNVASQWSGRDPSEIAKTLSSVGSEDSRDSSRDKFDSTPKGFVNGTSSSMSSVHRYSEEKKQDVPKPEIVKRMTSHQNETVETKRDFDGHSVKRAALNREGSLASNRLKKQYMPGYFDSKREVEILSSSMRQSSITDMLPDTTVRSVKPALVTKEDRMATLDMSALDLVLRPVALSTSSRSTTIEALNLDVDDPFASSQLDWLNNSSAGEDDNDDIIVDDNVPARPAALTQHQRLTTSDLIDIVNEPFMDD